MRGVDHQQSQMFSYLSRRRRGCGRIIRCAPSGPWWTRCSASCRGGSTRCTRAQAWPSIPPEKLLRAQLLQLLYSIRSERLLMEEIDYSILYRWFVGLNLDEEYGTRPPSPRTATDCCRPTWPRSFWRKWWRRRGRKA